MTVYFQSLVSIGQLNKMDNPIGHVNLRLLDPSTFVRPNTNVPLRNRSDTFKQFNSAYGQAVVRGADDHQFDNERVFGMYIICCVNTIH